MKLRNKKTGAIYKIEDIDLGNNADGIWLGMTRYSSLAELNEEWEDAEEPKKYWFIRSDSSTIGYSSSTIGYSLISNTRSCRNRKEIGNYFSSKEEAEKALKKLKAWKRLKDKGLVIKKWSHTPDMQLTTGSFLKIEGFIPAIMENIKDLDICFGGEE